MRASILFDAMFDLLGKDHVELVLAAMQKVVKHQDRELYIQTVHLSWRYTHTVKQIRQGEINRAEILHQQRMLIGSITAFLNDAQKVLPETLEAETAETAHALLQAIEGILNQKPQVFKYLGKADGDTERRPGPGNELLGWVVVMILLMGSFLGVSQSHKQVHQHAKQAVWSLAEAYELTHLQGKHPELALGEKTLSFWVDGLQTGMSFGQIQRDFIALRRCWKYAEKRGEEILSQKDWFKMVGVGPVKYRKQLTGKRAGETPFYPMPSREGEF